LNYFGGGRPISVRRHGVLAIYVDVMRSGPADARCRQKRTYNRYYFSKM
jgi:hypothetical protein